MTARPLPPHDLVAEAAVVASLLANCGRLGELAGLEAEAFYSTPCREVYRAIVALVAAGTTADFVTVGGWLRDHGRLALVGGVEFLVGLETATPTAANIAAHAALVARKARLRSVIATCQRLAAEGYDAPDDEASWLQGAAQAMLDIAQGASGDDTPRPLRELVEQALKDIYAARERGGPASGMTTGLEALDRVTLGLHRQHLCVLAGRPSMGKTSLATTLLLGAAARGAPALLLSLDTANADVSRRILCSSAGVSVARARAGRLESRDLTALAECIDAVRALPVWLIDRPGMTLARIDAAVRWARAELARTSQPPLGVVCIDYLQLAKSGGRVDTREQEVAEVSRGLKAVARGHDVCVLALAQINRKVEDRSSRRPTMADLRESGQIEQDADEVLLLHRGDYYEQDAANHTGLVDVIVAKQKDGPTGVIQLRFHPEAISFSDPTPCAGRGAR